jgi:hypothetical protein
MRRVLGGKSYKKANFIAANPSCPPLVRGGTKRQTLAHPDDGIHAIALERQAGVIAFDGSVGVPPAKKLRSEQDA